MRKSMLSSVLLGLFFILAVACGDADAGFFDEDLDPGEVLADDQGGDEEAGGQGANSDPVHQGITLNPFNLCTNETGTLRAEAVDAEGDPITHDWRVADAPAAAGIDDYKIAAWPVVGTASFSTRVPGEYEIELLLSDGRGGEAFGTYVVAVAICGAPGNVHGTEWRNDNGDGSRDAGEPGLAGVEIYMDLEAGETRVLSVSFTVEPLCIRPFDSIVTAPGAPAGVARSLTGVVGNSCGGDSSTFDIELTADGSPHAFDLVFIDQDSAFVIATLPVRISASLDGAHAILLSPGAVVEGLDFGNQSSL